MKTTSWHVLRGRYVLLYKARKNRGEKLVGAASCIARPPQRLAHNNFTKAQAAGLQLNCLHALVTWRRRVFHRSAYAKASELHETDARLTDLLAKGCGNAVNCGFCVVPAFGYDDAKRPALLRARLLLLAAEIVSLA